MIIIVGVTFLQMYAQLPVLDREVGGIADTDDSGDHGDIYSYDYD